MFALYLSMCASEEERSKIDYICRKYHSFMYHAAYKTVGNTDIAADVVHDTVIKLIKNSKRIVMDNEEALKTYIYTSVRNAAIDFMRKNGGKVTVDLDDLDSYLGCDMSDTALDVVISNYEYQRLVDCIRSLPDKYKDVFYLRYVCEMKEAEIAEELNITYDNVAARIYRGKKLLKNMMEEQKSGK